MMHHTVSDAPCMPALLQLLRPAFRTHLVAITVTHGHLLSALTTEVRDAGRRQGGLVIAAPEEAPVRKQSACC